MAACTRAEEPAGPVRAIGGRRPQQHEQWLPIARDVATKCLALSAKAVRATEVQGFEWGWSYRFEFAGPGDIMCAVRMPEAQVWSASLRPEWKAPPELLAAPGTEEERVRRAGEHYLTNVMKLALSNLEYMRGRGSDGTGVWLLDWRRRSGPSLTPGFIKLDVSVDDGTVSWYADLDVKLTAPSEPTVSKAAATQAAMAAAKRWEPRFPIRPKPHGWRLIGAETEVVFMPGEPAQAGQRLLWFVTLDETPPPGGWGQIRPRRCQVSLTATGPLEVRQVEVDEIDHDQPGPGDVAPADLRLPSLADLAGQPQTWGALVTGRAKTVVSNVLAEAYRPPAEANTRWLLPTGPTDTTATRSDKSSLVTAYSCSGTVLRLKVDAIEYPPNWSGHALELQVENAGEFCRQAGLPHDLPALVRALFSPVAQRGKNPARFGRLKPLSGYRKGQDGVRTREYELPGWLGYFIICWMLPEGSAGAWFQVTVP